MSESRDDTGLSRLDRETGWTLRRFAQEVNRLGTERGTPLRYREPSVHQWLGGHLPRESVRPLVLEALSRRLGRPVSYAEAGFPAPGEGAEDTAGTTEGLLALGRQDVDPSRRGVLGAGLFSVALTVPHWQDVVGRMETVARGERPRYGASDVAMVSAMTERISELDDSFGGRHARPMAAAFLVNTVVPYLRADAPESVRQAMMSAAADLCYLTGYMAVDEGFHGLAQRYYVKALELAGAAGDHLTYCTTLRGMSVQAVDLGHGREALRLADAAAAASPRAGPRMRAFLAGQQAHAAARTGDRARALAYLREAEAAMEKAESRAKAFGSYDPSSLLYHVSQVRYELRDIAGSVAALKESDRVRQGVFRRARVRHRCTLAERQWELGHLEDACRTWHLALDDYPDVHSGRADDRVRAMNARIRPHMRNHAAKELHARARRLAPALVGA
ncbi:tetratricopeptide repeat protein [Streptomyces sp. URMC 126]|uniref:tetratricopeptide repeat protein n=1 Tax=Streptomyces sp. URMC 126 TaxID=3423401 RepID=UPI003F1C4878